MMGKKHWLLVCLLVLILIGGFYGYKHFSSTDDSAGTAQKPRRWVQVIPAATEPFSEKLIIFAPALANESIDITSKTAAIISGLHFKDGQKVEKNALLVELQQDQERAELAAALTQLEQYKSEHKRLGQLLKQQATSQQLYEASRFAMQVAQSQVAQLQAQLTELTLRAPFTGVIGLRQFSVGAHITPGQVIAHLDQIDRIKADLSVPAKWLSQLKLGMPIMASTDTFGALTFTGQLNSIDSRVDAQSGNFTARIRLDNPQQQLKPGLLLRIELLLPSRPAFMIPEEAILQRQDQHYLFVLDAQQQVQQKSVQIGVRQAGKVEVLNGLTKDEQVVVRGMGAIKTGDKVQIQDPSTQHTQDQNSEVQKPRAQDLSLNTPT